MRFIIGFLDSIVLHIFVFVLIFRGGSSTPETAKTPIHLLDYANSSKVVQLTTDSPTSADATHRQIVVTVGSTQTTVSVYQGYQGTLLSSKSYANNPAAYASFLAGLQTAGFTLGVNDKKLSDERPYCAAGSRYIYQVKDGDANIERFWSTSCGGVGTFKGVSPAVRDLFQAQIPDYDTATAAFNQQ